MHTSLLLACAAVIAAPAVAQSTPPYLLINEIRIDHVGVGPPTYQYFELLGGGPNADLSAFTYLVIGDGEHPFDRDGVIEEAISLAGHSTNDRSLFYAAESGVLGTPQMLVPLNFEKYDNVTHVVVEGFSGALGDDLDTDNDGVLDRLPWTEAWDAISLVYPGDTHHHYAASLGGTVVAEDRAPAQVYRCRTSLHDVRIGDYGSFAGTDTPNEFNHPCIVATSAFCDPGAGNSVSAGGGVMGYTGTGSIHTNDSALVCTNVPDTFGVFVRGNFTTNPVVSPIGGTVCVGGAVVRMNRIVVGVANTATLPLDFSDPGLAESMTSVGDTRSYQYFHRDTAFPGGGNYSNGLTITWAY